MTRTEAILDVVGAHHKEPLARVVLQSIISDSGETDDGFVLRGTLASLAAWCGVPERTVRKRLDDLVEAKVIRRDGRRVEVLAAGLALWLDSEPAGAADNRPERPETGTSGRITNRPERPETGRSGRKPAPAAGLKPSRVRGRVSLSEQISNKTQAAAAAARVSEYASQPAWGADPDLPPEPGAPSSLTPPPPFVAPWPADEEPSTPPAQPPATGGPPPRALADQAFCDALQTTQLRHGWEEAVGVQLKAHGLEAVLAGARNLKAYLEENPVLLPRAQRSPKWCGDRIEMALAGLAGGRPSRSSQTEGARAYARATRNCPIPMDMDEWRAVAATGNTLGGPQRTKGMP